jgi:cell division septal protein FtsQ
MWHLIFIIGMKSKLYMNFLIIILTIFAAYAVFMGMAYLIAKVLFPFEEVPVNEERAAARRAKLAVQQTRAKFVPHSSLVRRHSMA